MDDLLLFQQVFTPTRQRQSQAPSILDLVLTDEEYSVNNLRVTDPLAKSDHFMIEFEYLCYTAVTECCITKYLYDIGDYHEFAAELLEIEWSQDFDALSVDDMWSHFHNIFDAFSQHPSRMSKARQT